MSTSILRLNRLENHQWKVSLPKLAHGILTSLFGITGRGPSGRSYCCAAHAPQIPRLLAGSLVPSFFAVLRLFPRLRLELPAWQNSPITNALPQGTPPHRPAPETRVPLRAHPSFPTHAAAQTSPCDAIVVPTLTPAGGALTDRWAACEILP